MTTTFSGQNLDSKRFKVAYSYKDYCSICKKNGWNPNLHIPYFAGLKKAKECSYRMRNFRNFDGRQYSQKVHEGVLKAYFHWDEKRIKYMLLALSLTKALHELEDGEIIDDYIRTQNINLKKQLTGGKINEHSTNYR